jgi:hypothetical protein
MRLLVIGGSDAGIASALRARELDPSLEALGTATTQRPRLGPALFVSGMLDRRPSTAG